MYLQSKDSAPHSVYCQEGLTTPMNSWTHRHVYLDDLGIAKNRTIVYRGNKNPTFIRQTLGFPIPTLHDEFFNLCFELINDIRDGIFLPEYVFLYDLTCADQIVCAEVCFKTFKELGLYDEEAKLVNQ